MIRRFRHLGLRRLYTDDDRTGLKAEHVDKVARVLALLNRAGRPGDMNLPGLRLHPLKGEFAGFWSVAVSANWRIIFRFEDRHATDVDLVDDH